MPRAIVRKEMSEYRRNTNIIFAIAILPLIFLIQPLIQVFALPSSASVPLRHEHVLLYVLAIPVLVPVTLAAYSIVGDRNSRAPMPIAQAGARRTLPVSPMNRKASTSTMIPTALTTRNAPTAMAATPSAG